jgi:hypothetical protein
MEQNRTETAHVDICNLPTRVKVVGFSLRGDEAAIDVDPPAAGAGKRLKSSMQPRSNSRRRVV